MARFSGSAQYLRMASRYRRRLPSVRQPSEQYERGLPGFQSSANSLPHARHLRSGAGPAPPAPAAAGEEADAARPALALAAPEARLRRLRPRSRHPSEQYRTDRLRVENALPHSPHCTDTALAISAAALALHASQ